MANFSLFLVVLSDFFRYSVVNKVIVWAIRTTPRVDEIIKGASVRNDP
jgi:hypothetical protein